MPSFVRSVMAVLAGCLVAFVHIGAIETLGHIIYPPPEGLDPSKPETLAAYMKVIPLGAILMVLLAYAVGSFAGSWFAARLAPSPKRNHGLVIGALFSIANVANMAMIPHPSWFWAASVVTIPLVSYLGSDLGASRAERVPVPTEPTGQPS